MMQDIYENAKGCPYIMIFTGLAVVMASVTPHMALANVSPTEFNAAIAVASPIECELGVTATNTTVALSYEVTGAQLAAGDAGVLKITDGAKMVVTIHIGGKHSQSDCQLNRVTLSGQDGGEAVGPQKHVRAYRTKNGLLWPMQFTYGMVRGFNAAGARTSVDVGYYPFNVYLTGKRDPTTVRWRTGDIYSNQNTSGHAYGAPNVAYKIFGDIPVGWKADTIPSWAESAAYSMIGEPARLTIGLREAAQRITVDVGVMIGTRPYSSEDGTPGDGYSIGNGEVIRGTGTLIVTAS
ncbi:hypothetical protein ACSOQX_003017 [Yersinia enterocolitica]|nr:hypothetical protein [Yersinia enterocolitica]EKN5104604.1 hypothetical protein [Yersinia enterocolitica]